MSATARELLRVGYGNEQNVNKLVAGSAAGSVLAARVEEVLALHVEGKERRRGICSGCGLNWPCPTVRLLDGESL